jgi:hypothetical protein
MDLDPGTDERALKLLHMEDDTDECNALTVAMYRHLRKEKWTIQEACLQSMRSAVDFSLIVKDGPDPLDPKRN